ncbi:MAG: 1-deoxy-D-xylulose-5-phosphate reductoisomerase [SAR202 cluster bacterium]|nr:1-deoxy-D-xylulose-5-phosphate reductoisomerase [SAR202 cluster bacterium]
MGTIAKGLAVLGSTGSIGTQTLDIVRTFPDRFRVVGLAARRSLNTLESQVREFRPRLVSCEGSRDEKAPLFLNGSRESTLDEMVRDPEVDTVVTATVGDVSLAPTIAAINAGKHIALANKESIILAGGMLTELARRRNVQILPLDSEPNAIWQCLRGEDMSISRLIITASGGAFRNLDPAQLAAVTPEQALKHPTWTMGKKITIDSATLMNKAFEVIEAHYLFGVPWEQIEVVIHPQSLIHSMVEFVDGSVKAQISPPDMRLPIQYALLYPDRVYNKNITRFNPVVSAALTFQEMRPKRYPCFELAIEVAKRGGTWPAALCGADDAAVDMFLARKIGFLDIHSVIREALWDFESCDDPSIEDVLLAASIGRERVRKVVEEA